MKSLGFLLCFFLLALLAEGQDNYEIQVYGSETVEPKATMVELHSNYTFSGVQNTGGMVFSSNHMVHETVEITHGFTPWFEMGFYFFNALGSEGRSGYVGSHIRPRVRVPDQWQWPVGVSLSMEVGYQKPQYSEDDWSLEIRPIVDRKIGRTYLAFNPTFEEALHGENANKGFLFSPNVKASFDATKAFALGVEYYGAVGKFFHFDPFVRQQHQLFAAADLNVSDNWEINFGYGWGLTKSTDKSIAKLILGYRIKKGNPASRKTALPLHE